MKKSLFTAIAAILLIFAFVSCSGNVAPEDKLGKITFGEENSKAVTTVVVYSNEVEDLVWFYSATKLDDGYTTGQTNGFVSVAAATKESGETTSYTPTNGLSGKTLDSVGFSYGLWKIELQGYKEANVEVSTEGTITIKDNTDAEYVSTVNNFLVNKGANYATAEIELGDNAETTIVFASGENAISFSSSNIKATSDFTLAVTDSVVGSTVTVSTGDSDVVKVDGKITFKNITYTVSDNTDITGEHVMKFVLSQKLKNLDSTNETENTTIEAAVYTLKFTVKKGTKTTIGGTLLKNDTTGTIQINTVQNVEPLTMHRVLDVENIDESVNTAKVSSSKTITYGNNFKVTYENGTLISTTADGVTVEDSVSKKGTADAKLGILRNDEATPEGIEIEFNEAKENYELTLSASESANSTNSKLVKVEFFYGKNRVVSAVYHDGVSLDEYSTLSDDAGADGKSKSTTESYSYNSETGVMTLRVFHASSITIVTKEAVAKIGDTLYYSLEDVISKAEADETIKFIQNVTLNDNLKLGKSVTLDLDGKELNIGNYSIEIANDTDMEVIIKNGKINSVKGENDPVLGDYVIVSTRTVTFQNVNFVQSGLACTVIFVLEGKLSIIDSEFSCNARDGVVSGYGKEAEIEIEGSKIINSGTKGKVTYQEEGETKESTITPAAVVSTLCKTLEISNSTIEGTGTEAQAVNIYFSNNVTITNSKITTTGDKSITIKQEFGEVTISGESTVINGYCALDITNGTCTVAGATIKTSNTTEAVLHVANTSTYNSTLTLNKVTSDPESVKVYSEGANAKITSSVTNKTAMGNMEYGLNLATFSGYNN